MNIKSFMNLYLERKNIQAHWTLKTADLCRTSVSELSFPYGLDSSSKLFLYSFRIIFVTFSLYKWCRTIETIWLRVLFVDSEDGKNARKHKTKCLVCGQSRHNCTSAIWAIVYQGTTHTSLSSLSPNPVKMKKLTPIIILIVQLIAMSTVCSCSVMTVKLSTKHEVRFQKR